MELEERDIPIIVEKGFTLAKDLLSPNSFHSIAVHQDKGTWGNFKFNDGKLRVKTQKETIDVNPDKITEQGVAICKTTDGDLFFAEGGRKGVFMQIKPRMCKPRGEYVGSLHTHPGGNPAPSGGDLSATTHNKDKIMCIATRSKEKEFGVNCYIPKTELLPEEIFEKDNNIMGILENLTDYTMNIEFPPNPMQTAILKQMGVEVKGDVAQIPVYDIQKIKWFTSALMDEVRDIYDIRKFRREL